MPGKMGQGIPTSEQAQQTGKGTSGVILEWSATIGAFVGLGFFLMGLLQHNHSHGNKHKLLEAFALTVVGTALLDLGLFALRFRLELNPQPGSEQMVYLIWGFTFMMMLMTGFSALRPHRLRRFW